MVSGDERRYHDYTLRWAIPILEKSWWSPRFCRRWSKRETAATSAVVNCDAQK